MGSPDAGDRMLLVDIIKARDFHLRFDRQRDVNSHLITIEVSVVRSANERVQLDSLTFNKYWLKCLNAKTVQVSVHG